MLDCRPSHVPMDPSIKLSSEDGELIPNAEAYRGLGKYYILPLYVRKYSLLFKSYDNILQLLKFLISKLHKKFFIISKEPSAKLYFTPLMMTFRSKHCVIQIGHNVPILNVLSPGFASSMAILWCPGNRRINMSFLIHPLRLNIALWPSPLKKLYG